MNLRKQNRGDDAASSQVLELPRIMASRNQVVYGLPKILEVLSRRLTGSGFGGKCKIMHSRRRETPYVSRGCAPAR
jgi:hypothetical protein